MSNTALLHYIDFSPNKRKVQSFNNNKNHKDIIIKYLLQQLKWLKEKQKIKRNIKVLHLFSAHETMLLKTTKTLHLMMLFLIYDFLKLCNFSSSRENDAVQNKQWKLTSNLLHLSWSLKEEFLERWQSITNFSLPWTLKEEHNRMI